MEEKSLFSDITGLGDLITIGIAIMIIIGSIISIFGIMYGGIQLIFSGGKELKITKAIKTIRYAIIGLAIMVVTVYSLPFLGRLLGIDIAFFTKPGVIIDQIKTVGKIIFPSS